MSAWVKGILLVVMLIAAIAIVIKDYQRDE